MKKYDTVIFDLDRTLLDTLEDLTNSVNYTLELYGFPFMTLAEVRSFVGNGVARLMEFLEQLSKEDYKIVIVSNKFDTAVKGLNQTYFGEYIKVSIVESENSF